MPPSRLHLALLAFLLVGLAAAAPAAAQTPDYDPANAWVGMTVTASHGEITAGETYDLRRADELSGGEIHSSQFVEELRAEVDGELRVDTTDLEPDHNYFITGPGLASRSSVTASETFELRGQDLEAGFDDDEDEETADDHESDDTESDDHTDPGFYGSVTINNDTAPVDTEITAKVDGETRGSTTVSTAGNYGNATDAESHLTVNGTTADEGSEITFRITTPDGDQHTAAETATWSANTTTEQPLSVTTDDASEETETDPPVTNATDSDNQSDTDTTETAPGFGLATGIAALFVILVLGRRRTSRYR